VLGGGVANSRALREAIASWLGGGGALFAPSPRLATDNAAMIARAALFRYGRGEVAGLELNARADLPFPGLRRPDGSAVEPRRRSGTRVATDSGGAATPEREDRRP
jgi:hypothetical protein